MQPTPRAIAPLLAALFFAGVGYLIFLENASQLVYVDENALLVGMASTEMGGHEAQSLQSFEFQLGSLGNKTRDFVRTQLLMTGMDVSEYTPTGSSITITHGVLRAQKGDGKQAMLLVIGYHDQLGLPTEVPGGLSIGLALMKHLSTTSWRSKDIVFVAVPLLENKWESFEAFEMWVHTYHGGGDRSFARAGNIIAALTLDIPRGVPFSTLSIIPGGHFGLLPNLDLISVVTRVFATNGVSLTVCESASTPKRLLERTPSLPAPLRGDIKGFLRCFLSQLGGVETGFHGALLNYNVDAVTLRAVVGEDRQSRSRWNLQNAMSIMRSVEGCFRSWNNLIEKLHHSTFLYILISPNVFTIMEKCIPGCVAMGLPLLLYGASLIFFTGPSRFLHSFAVLIALYVLSFSVLLLPRFLDWHYLAASLLVETLLVLFVYLPYVNAMFPPSFRCEAVSAKIPAGYVDDTWVNYASFKALAMMVIILTLSPLGIIDFPLASTAFLVIVPLLVPMVPVRFPKPDEPRRKTQLLLYCLSRMEGLLALVLFSPPVLLFVVSFLFGIQPTALLQACQSLLLEGRNLTMPTLILTYLPAYLVALVLYTLYWVPSKSKQD